LKFFVTNVCSDALKKRPIGFDVVDKLTAELQKSLIDSGYLVCLVPTVSVSETECQEDGVGSKFLEQFGQWLAGCFRVWCEADLSEIRIALLEINSPDVDGEEWAGSIWESDKMAIAVSVMDQFAAFRYGKASGRWDIFFRGVVFAIGSR